MMNANTITAKLAESLEIGPLTLRNRVILAPMSGISDAPFRRLAHGLGAGLTVSEMVASEGLLQENPNMRRRMLVDGVTPKAVQLAGREAYWMGEGAKRAEQEGAQLIDINMGCPARRVTSGLSGSALMRDLDHALTLIETTVAAVGVPVTLKMRLGWNEDSLNAPELARRAERAGVRMITVHGRTRCQFYQGKADWRAIAQVKQAVSIPVIANGDLASLDDVEPMLAQSAADGVMVGRASMGRPWLLGQIADHAAGGTGAPPSAETRGALMQQHYRDMIALYGADVGVRHARKHLAAYVEHGGLDPAAQKIWRERICRQNDPRVVEGDLRELTDDMIARAAAQAERCAA